ncbi:transglycosylase domain-containing protein [Candidatus Haliotispira prima]|uniref:Transglycosylase domain-containing protein n=1 Tax=Candidatus Haliotispira prima TaxID=3034016 RepID=A0ABY8MEP9_9SPIO|nr:transglycosylase domain-containing protein [Candidatus Haliotispira prima]
MIAGSVFVIFLSIALGTALGKLLCLGSYVGAYESLITNDQPLPSRIYDINNNLITEISQGSRELLAQNELTRNLIYALMGREDSTFFEHNGFSLVGTVRALTYIILDRFTGTGTAGGGSTLTQQLAGSLKADRKDISVSRKIRELWWAFIFERHYAKNEILVTYLNNVYFGDRNHGIEAASRFFFGHSARDNSIVEAVLAIIQLARPNGDFSPLRHPEMAKLRQEAVLDKIIQLGLMTEAQTEQASQEYWDSFDLTKISQRSPKRIDEAPYFSDYVARILEKRLYGTDNLLQAGYSIYTTLDLNVQRQVDEIVREEMDLVDSIYQSQNLNLFTILERQELPELGRLRTLFGLNLNLSGGRAKRAAEQTLQNQIAPTLETLVTVLGLESQMPMLKMSAEHLDKFFARTVPETAMLAMDNHTGNIVAMVGGRTYNINEARLFNRAVDARVPPGSSFKPLYFAAAFEDRVVTGGTVLADGPYRFISPNGDPYIPANYYAGRFSGTVLPRRALQLSLNIPAIHVLDIVGFNKGIGMSTRLLGISDPKVIRRDFPFVFPVALGTSPVAPIQQLRAYTAFVNKGIPQDPNPIRYVEDRNGQIVYNYEQESLRKSRDSSRRVLSEQTAYVMTKMLESVPQGGTLSGVKYRFEEKYGRFKFPLAAKTGTAENWSDGWVVGYTPRYTTVVWVGFDQAGNSLGEILYGGKVAGPMFMRTMGLLHQNEDTDVSFERPEGVFLSVVDKRNGYHWVASCGEENQSYEWFIQGTGPPADCTQAPKTSVFNYDLLNYQNSSEDSSDQESAAIDLSDFDFLNESVPSSINNENDRNYSEDLPESEPTEDGEQNQTQDRNPATEDDAENANDTNGNKKSPTKAPEPEDSDQFLKNLENTRSELDSIIESDN